MFFSARDWASFLSASLLDEVMNCFENDVAAAIVIWRRHQVSLFQLSVAILITSQLWYPFVLSLDRLCLFFYV